jgi:hypothetical protein
VGVLRPTIILPQCVVANRPAMALEPLLAHELIHVRRGDLWWAMLQTVATSVWWFHPLVRYAATLMHRESERSCDEETVACLNCPPAKYARSLLDVLEQKYSLRAAPALPGVRPIDITAKRMERIMRLGQGCHARSPRWIVAAMIVGAGIVLPGAQWVEGQTSASTPGPSGPSSTARGVQDHIATPDSQFTQTRPQPWAAGPSANSNRNWSPMMSAGDHGYSLKKFDVEDLLRKTCDELQIDRNTAGLQLACPLPEFTWPGPGQPNTPDGLTVEFLVKDHGSCKLGGNEPLAKVVGNTLYVFGTDAMHERMAKSLTRIRQYGFHQIAVETRIVQIPAALINELDLRWSVATSESVRPVTQVTSVEGVHSNARISAVVIDGDDALKFANTTAGVEETAQPTPTLYRLLDAAGADDLLALLQKHPRVNVVQAPKITLFNGQDATVADTVSRPFVVSVREVRGDEGIAHAPVVRVIEEGTKISLRPVLSDDHSSVELTCSILRTAVNSVDEFSFKFPEAREGEGVTVQVPDVACQALRVEDVAVPSGSTLLVGSMPMEIDGRKVVTMAFIKAHLINVAKPSPAEEVSSAPLDRASTKIAYVQNSRLRGYQQRSTLPIAVSAAEERRIQGKFLRMLR